MGDSTGTKERDFQHEAILTQKTLIVTVLYGVRSNRHLNHYCIHPLQKRYIVKKKKKIMTRSKFVTSGYPFVEKWKGNEKRNSRVWKRIEMEASGGGGGDGGGWRR